MGLRNLRHYNAEILSSLTAAMQVVQAEIAQVDGGEVKMVPTSTTLLSGFACAACDTEMQEDPESETLDVSPPRRALSCPACGYEDSYIVVKAEKSTSKIAQTG